MALRTWVLEPGFQDLDIWLSGPGSQDLDKRTLLFSSVAAAVFLQRECCCIWLSGPGFQDLAGVCLPATTTRRGRFCHRKCRDRPLLHFEFHVGSAAERPSVRFCSRTPCRTDGRTDGRSEFIYKIDTSSKFKKKIQFQSIPSNSFKFNSFPSFIHFPTMSSSLLKIVCIHSIDV